jgi:hypothetical protein
MGELNDDLNSLFGGVAEGAEDDPFLQELKIVMTGDNPLAMIGRLLAFGAENIDEIQLRVRAVEAAQDWVKSHMVAIKREAARRKMTPDHFVKHLLDDNMAVYKAETDAEIEDVGGC